MSKYGFNEVCDAIDAADEQYIRTDDEGELIEESVEKFLTKIIPICRSAKSIKEKPYLNDLYYIRGICRNRFVSCVDLKCMEVLQESYDAGADIENMKTVAKEASNWTCWLEEMEDLKCLVQEI